MKGKIRHLVLAALLLLAADAHQSICQDTHGCLALMERNGRSGMEFARGGRRSAISPDSFRSQDDISVLLEHTERPFVLISERELSVLRRGLSKPGWKRSLYLQEVSDAGRTAPSGVGLLARANRCLAREVVIPARAGHYHHFFCDDGTMLQFPDSGSTGFRCPACGRIYTGDRYEAAFRCFLHSELASGALACGLVYAIENEKAYAEKTAEILLRYADAYPGPHTSATEGGILYQTLDEAVWIIRLAQAYDLIYDSPALKEADKEKIDKKLFRPVAQGLIAGGIRGNWGSWHLSAAGVIGFAIKDAALVEYSIKSFQKQIREQLGSDGLWPESVHCYHFYPLSAFIHLAEAAYRVGIDLYNWRADSNRSLKAMFLSPLYYAYPDFQLPAINDGWFYSYIPLGLYEIAYRRYGDPIFAWVLKRGYKFGEEPVNETQRMNIQNFRRNSLYAFLFGRDMPGRVGEPAFGSTDFPVLGIVVLRTPSGNVATLDYGPFLGHGHLDKMSLTLYGADRLLVPDFGTPGYGSKILPWYIGTPSHNTVVVDGRDQERTDESRLLEFRKAGLLQVAMAETRQAYPGVQHTRRLLLTNSALYVIDRLSSDEEHTYDWFLRARGDLELDGGLRMDEAPCGYDEATESRCAEVGNWSARWKGTAAGLRLWMWQPSGSTLFTCSVPAETAAIRAQAVISRQHAKEAQFIACLVPHRPGSDVISERIGRLFRVCMNGIDEWLFIRDAQDFDAPGSPMSTDGELVCVRIREDRVVSCLLVRGSFVSWKGQVIVEVSQKIEQIEANLETRNPQIQCSGMRRGYIKLRTSARAMRLNGRRISASGSDGTATLRIESAGTPRSDDGMFHQE